MQNVRLDCKVNRALPPNHAFEPTPRGGEQDRRDFDSWKSLDRVPDLSVRRS